MNNLAKHLVNLMPQVCFAKTWLAFILVLASGAVLFNPRELDATVVQDGGVSNGVDETGSEEASDLTEAQKLESEQTLLADRYKLLEEKLFSLHEFEKVSNPVRSKLLRRAFLQSQEKMTASQMKSIVKLLTKTKLKAAEGEQDQVLAQLNALLDLLQSEDRGKRVRDEIQRHQEYLKEVERILRIQKGIRGQTEGGVDSQRLINSENKTANRTRDLADEIRENEEHGDPSEFDETSDSNSSQQHKQPEEHSDESNSNAPSSESDNPVGENSDSGNRPSQGEGQPGQPGSEGEQGESGKDGNGGQDQNENPTRKRIEAAEKLMRDAQQKLEKALRGESIEAMKEAEREIALAKKELEEILRQLREEEVERTLAMLEGRFRQMLERQVRVHDTTQKLDRIVTEQRGTEFEIRAGKLSVEQNSIATEAARALLLLREDGSSVAFPATVDELHQDMVQVATRLSAAKVGRITIEIEEDIVDTLNYLIKALVTTQEDMERMKQQQSDQQGGQPGDKPLVDQLAEIKMLRGLQERIFRRHQRYARFLDDQDDPVGDTDDPELQAALLRLANKQAKLTDIARDIVNEKNK